jgi:hypothetical protein
MSHRIPTCLVAFLVVACAAAPTVLADEFTKGTYSAHPQEDQSQTVSLTFSDESKVVVRMNDQVVVEGTYTVKSERIEIIDRTGPLACDASQVGAYNWKLDGKTLTFKMIEDACDPRKAALTGQPWTLQPAPARSPAYSTMAGLLNSTESRMLP